MIESVHEFAIGVGRSLRDMSHDLALFVVLGAVSPLVVAVIVLLKLREARHWGTLPRDRVNLLVYRVVRSPWGLGAVGLTLLLITGWGVALVLFKIVTAIEIGRLSGPGAGRKSPDFILTCAPPVGIGVSGWALVELWRARGRVRRLAAEAKRAP